MVLFTDLQQLQSESTLPESLVLVPQFVPALLFGCKGHHGRLLHEFRQLTHSSAAPFHFDCPSLPASVFTTDAVQAVSALKVVVKLTAFLRGGQRAPECNSCPLMSNRPTSLPAGDKCCAHRCTLEDSIRCRERCYQCRLRRTARVRKREYSLSGKRLSCATSGSASTSIR